MKINCFYVNGAPYYGLENGNVFVSAEKVKKMRLTFGVSTGEALLRIEENALRIRDFEKESEGERET